MEEYAGRGPRTGMRGGLSKISGLAAVLVLADGFGERVLRGRVKVGLPNDHSAVN
jgi:hypothetical protein